MWQYADYNELYHHGIPGMKWGIRKARQLIGGAARARSGYSNSNPQYTFSNVARKSIGNAFMKAAYGKSRGPQRLSGKREFAAKMGRKILGRKTVRAQAATYKYTKSGVKLSSNTSELLKHMHLTYKNCRINVGGNDFRRLSRSKKIRNVVHKSLNSLGTMEYQPLVGKVKIRGRNYIQRGRYLTSVAGRVAGRNLGYETHINGYRPWRRWPATNFKRLR